MNVKFPEITVKLIGKDGNAFNLIGLVARELRRKVGSEAASEFTTQATSCGSYNELLRLIMSTVNVE